MGWGHVKRHAFFSGDIFNMVMVSELNSTVSSHFSSPIFPFI